MSRAIKEAVAEPQAPWLHPDDIAGGAEIRRLAGGVTRHTLINWRRDPAFPQPIARLEIGEVWDLRAVRAWMRSRA